MKKLLLAVCALSFIGHIQSQTTTSFRINYDQALMDLPGNAIEGLTANTYVFAGTNVNFLPIYGTVTQIDNSGALTWAKRYYDGSFGFQISDIKKDASLNEYYVCGGSESNAGVFMRLDAAGNVVVSKKFSIAEADGAYLQRVIKVSDGGYVAVGYVTGHDPDGAGPEQDFAPITYTDNNGDSQTDYISSPLIVKFDASGNHLWHKVFRYYTSAAKTTAIYNDAWLNDVVETTDGYIAVGQYDVNQHRSNTNSDGDDATATDAIVLKTTTAGTITYHKQYDTQNTSPTQSSKTLQAISLTSTGVPIAAGTDNSREWIVKFAGTGGWVSTFSRLFTYPGFGAVADVSQVYEVTGSTDLVTMAMYINPFAFTFADAMHRVNSTATTNVWAKTYTFGLATILPRGSKTSDLGYIMISTAMAASFDYHIIKTDPNGDTPISGGTPTNCAAGSITPTAAAGTTTTSDPYNNNYSGTVSSQTLVVTVANISPTTNIQCSKVIAPCTPPAAATTVTATPSTICPGQSSTITASGPASNVTYNVYTAATGGTNLGAAPLVVNPVATTTYYLETADNNDPLCVSVTRVAVTVTVDPAPTAPVIGTITQTTCTVSTGSVALSGLPASGTWTVTASPGGATITGTGTIGTFTGLAPGTYTFTVESGGGGGGPVTAYSEDYDGNGGAGSTWATLNQNVGAQGSAANLWYISDQEDGNAAGQCGSAGSGDQSLHVGSSTVGDAGAAYDASADDPFLCGFLPPFGCPVTTNKRSFSQNINTTGITGMTLAFNYIENGEGSDDNAILEFSLDGGTSWLTLFDLAKTPLGACAPQGTWTAYSIALPPTCENITNLRIGFRWQNDADGNGTDPSFAVDDITITGTSGGGGGCASIASTSATINPQPTTPSAPVLGTVTQPTCSTPTGSVALSVLPASGTWTVTGSSSGSLTSTGTTGTVTGLTPGSSYTFTVTNASGCTSTASTASGMINAAPSVPTAPLVGTITQPDCTIPAGSVALSGLPASGSWTVTGSPSGSLTSSGTTGTITGLTAGASYTFTVTNADGCTSTASTSANINTVPGAPSAPVIGTITQPTCTVATGSIALSVLPASGTWTITGSPSGSATGTGTTTTISGLSAGTSYTFTVTNNLGCTSSASASGVLNAQPSTPSAPVLGTVTQPDCTTPTGSVALSGLPASGTWTVTGSPSGSLTSTGTTGTVTGLAPGSSYTFTVTNVDGCTSSGSTATGTINAAPTAPSVPIVGTITQPTCATPTGSVALSGLPASGSWTVTGSPSGSLTSSGTTGTVTGLTAGASYTFTVTNADGCTSTASTSANINTVPGAPSAPVIGTITQPTCTVATGSIALSGLPASGTWTITGSPSGSATGTGTTTTISGLAAGTSYTFTVTNDLGCTSSASTSGVLNTQPTTPSTPVVGTVTQPDCTTPTGSVDLSGLPASETWTVTGSPSGSLTSTGTTGTVTGLTPGSSYTYTVTDNTSGCTSSASTATGTINAAPTVPTSPIVGTITQPTCTTPTGTVDLGGLPASGTWTITGSPSGSATGTGTIGSVTGLAPGASYTFTVTNASGCTSVTSTSAVINSLPAGPTAPSAGTTVQPTCAVPTGTIEVTAPIGSYSYSIDGTNFQSSTTFTGVAPGSYMITVQDDNTGCSTPSTSQVVIDPVTGAPIITVVSTTDASCNGLSDGALEISVSGGASPYTYAWTPNADSGAILTSLAAGSYTVDVTDNTGCSSSETITINEPNAVAMNGTSSNVDCVTQSGGSITTAASGGDGNYSYTWTPNGETTASLTNVPAGSYGVTVTDGNGCSATSNYSITTTGSLPVVIDPDYSLIDQGTSVQLTATGGTNYSWTPGSTLSCSNCPNPIASPTTTTTYYLSATDDNGCTGGDTAVVELKIACGDIYVPNTFSPNGTGPAANNTLKVFGNPACVEQLVFRVFDRWGELVFETTSMSEEWNGQYKGKDMNTGIFVYTLYVLMIDGNEIDESGNVTLVR